MTSDFAAIITQTVADGRALIQSLMTDTCTITRAGIGKGPFNEATGQYDPPPRTEVYGPSTAPHFGKCRLQIKSIVANASDNTAGDRRAIVQESELQLPVSGTDDIAIGDTAEMLTSVNDPALVERVYTIAARHQKSQATARRLRVEEVAG